MENFEDLIFQYLENAKLLFFPEQWNTFFLNCSKNELFVLFLLYRKKEVTMTEIAEYIHVPLNTATGIVSRMEKRDLLQRERSVSDKRVVTVAMTARGIAIMKEFLDQVVDYGECVLNELTKEEQALLLKVIEKVMGSLQQKQPENCLGDLETNQGQRKVKKIEII